MEKGDSVAGGCELKDALKITRWERNIFKRDIITQDKVL
jgi:hypothetical protein